MATNPCLHLLYSGVRESKSLYLMRSMLIFEDRQELENVLLPGIAAFLKIKSWKLLWFKSHLKFREKLRL